MGSMFRFDHILHINQLGLTLMELGGVDDLIRRGYILCFCSHDIPEVIIILQMEKRLVVGWY